MTALSIAEAEDLAAGQPRVTVRDPRAARSAASGNLRVIRATGGAAGRTGTVNRAATPDRIVTPARIVSLAPARQPGVSGSGPVRLTRRGRIVLGGLALAVVAAVACLISLGMASGALASSHGAARAGYRGMRPVVVESGQTLWSIAVAADPGADPRAVVRQIMETNSLSAVTVYPGEQLWVPGH